MSSTATQTAGADAPLLLREDAGGIATLTLNRGPSRNALSLGLMAALQDALDAIAEDRAVRVVVLRGAGPAFCAGHDLKEMRADPSRAATEAVFRTCARLMLSLTRLPQPVIAQVHGIATAAGCQLVASCDLAVAAESAGFATPGGKFGWFCHTPMVAVARNVGRKRAMEMALTGDVIDAATALDWGLVNRVVPDDELDAAVADLLGRATRGSRASKAWGKQTMYAQLDRPERDAYATAIEVMAAFSQLDGAREGMSAFLEKRPPVWTD